MKLNIKQKVFSFNEKFSILDENGNEKYYVEGEIISLGKKLHLYSLQEEEIAYIHQKVLALLPHYFISVEGKDEIEVEKKISLTPKFVVDDLGWEVEGDFLAHEYDIKKGEDIIANVSKKWFSWGDSYEIDVKNDADVIMALSVILVIDADLSNQDNLRRARRIRNHSR